MKKLVFFLFSCFVGCFVPVLSAQVTVAPFTSPQWQFFDNSGKPLNGGCVNFFAAGTSTPQPTYTDSTGTVQATNPVILDSAGRAAIWLSALTYKIQVKTFGGVNCASGSQLWVQDNVTWNTASTTLAGATITGNFLISQTVAATGGANQSGFTDCNAGNYWTGAASAVDKWCWQDVLGTGSNPTSTYTLTHSGSSGVTNIGLPAGSNLTFASAVIGGPAPWIDVTSPVYGAKGDANIVSDATLTAATFNVSSATASFAAGDVGKQCSATPTKYSTTNQITCTISAFISSTSVTISVTTGSMANGTNVRFTYGTDNTTAIQAAITAAQALQKGDDGGNGNNPYSSGMPPVYIPASATGMGYIITGPLNVTKSGFAFISQGREQSQLIGNTTTAQIKFAAPSGTYHGLFIKGLTFECGYIANTGLTLDSIEESHIENIRINDCMAAGSTGGLTLLHSTGTNGLNTFIDFRAVGNVVAIYNDSSQQTVFYHCNIYGSISNSNTLTGIKMVGTHVLNNFNGCWMEGLFRYFLIDNTSADNTSNFVYRDGRLLSTVTEARFLEASSVTVGNKLYLNVMFDGNEIQTTAATHWSDLLMNGNSNGGSQMNVRWSNNIRDAGPSGTLFNTDSSLIHILYADNNGVGGANINTGAGVVFGWDCGAETQLGPNCQNTAATVNFTGATAVNVTPVLSVTNGVQPASAAGSNAGSGSFPFFHVVLGGSAAHNTTLASLASTNQTDTFPDGAGTVGINLNATNGIYQSKRGVAGCTTGAAAGNSCGTDITVTWTNPFADANYSVSCIGNAPTNVPSGPFITSGTKLAGSVHINYFAITAAAAAYATIDCIGVHD